MSSKTFKGSFLSRPVLVPPALDRGKLSERNQISGRRIALLAQWLLAETPKSCLQVVLTKLRKIMYSF